MQLRKRGPDASVLRVQRVIAGNMGVKQIIFLLFVANITYGQIQGKVVGIIDGDTFTLLTSENKQIKIRLHGIDCPEGRQDFGNQAKQYLSNLIFSKHLKIQDKGLDRYGRTIGIVFFDNMNINEAMLSNGMAWHFKKYDKNPKWDNLESEARILKKGLWAQENPTPPWEWRSNKKQR